MTTELAALFCAVLCAAGVNGQSNYASHGNNIEYQGEGLPPQTVLDGKVTKLDDLSPVIFLNRTKATLNCVAGSMQVELKFNEPFFGIAYADFDRNSACQIAGKGNLSYHIELPLKGCGTRQKPQRVFTNNIVVRFHPAFDMDGDEIITIVCRYPPPVAPLPAALPAPILEPVVPPVPLKPPLEGYQILLIICAILFLSLLLLGLGCSYYCLKNRRVKVVHKPFSTVGTGSEITKLSGSSLGNISMFEGLKIPRAHAPPTATASSSEALIPSEHSDTMPSDYPSESPSSAHSEVEDVDTRSLPELFHEIVAPPLESAAQKFDVQVRVKRAPPPPPITPTDSISDAESIMAAQARNLTTILEREESIRSLENVPKPIQSKTTFTYVPELCPPPPPKAVSPVYSTILRKEQKQDVALDMTVADIGPISVASPDAERTERGASEVVSVRKRTAPPPPSILPYKTETEESEHAADLIEPPVVASRRPEITSHVVDDVFLRTITEKRTIEDIERHKRLVTEYHQKPLPPPPKWDVTIRNYPAPGQELRKDPMSDWDSYSETSTVTMPTTPVAERHLPEINIERSYLSQLDVPAPHPPLQNWDVLARVLKPSYITTEDIRVDEPSTEILTTTDREKWRKIITTESTLRTLLTEATVREDYERIRKDQRYEQLFEPKKWDVIIRILSPPERVAYDKNGQPGNARYKKKPDWDNRSRRSSLPTLYEYDSDGGSSVLTLVPDVQGTSAFHDLRSRRTSRSSFRSDGTDVRSMTEVVVDYSRTDRADTLSDVSSRPSSYYRQSRPYYDEDEPDYGYARGTMVRSASQPSLARSASEFTEHWRKWDPDTEPSSPEHSPKSVRSGRTSIAGSTVSTQRRRQAIINKTLGTTSRTLGTASGLSRSSESVLEPNEALTPFARLENELYSSAAISKSDGRLDDLPTLALDGQQEIVYSRSTRTSTETIKTSQQRAWH